MRKDYIATIKCEVIKEVVLKNCTREEAEASPWDFAEEELEIGQNDWEILDIEENK